MVLSYDQRLFQLCIYFRFPVLVQRGNHCTTTAFVCIYVIPLHIIFASVLDGLHNHPHLHRMYNCLTMWMLLTWIAGVAAIGLFQRVQAKSDLPPPDFFPPGNGKNTAGRPSVETHNVPAGFPAAFTCKQQDVTNVTVSWLHNTTKIMDATQDKNTRYAVKTEPGTSTFTIDHVQVRDQGTVTCQVLSGAGLVEGTVTFEVSKIAIEVNQRNVSDEIAYILDTTITATYTCAIKYAPKDAKLSWYDKETELNSTTCKDGQCEVISYPESEDVKKAIVMYSAVKFVPKDGLRCKLINSTGGTAQQSGVIKQITFNRKPKFCGMHVTNKHILVESGEMVTITCVACIDPKYASKLLLYINNTKVAESDSCVGDQRLVLTYPFVAHPENNTARVECKIVNETHGELEPSAKLPLRVLFGPDDRSVIVTAPATVSPNQKFEVRCHSGNKYRMLWLHWFAIPGKSYGTYTTHTEPGETMQYGSIWVTPEAGATSINITCMTRKPHNGQIVQANAVVYVNAESAADETGAESSANIQPAELTGSLPRTSQPVDHDEHDAVFVGVGSVAAAAGVVGLLMVVLWVIHRTSGHSTKATLRAICVP